MKDFEAVQEQIRQARIQRSVYLAGLLSGAVASTWHGLKFAAATIAAAERSKDPDKLLTFEA
jgi:hypothetical protein